MKPPKPCESRYGKHLTFDFDFAPACLSAAVKPTLLHKSSKYQSAEIVEVVLPQVGGLSCEYPILEMLPPGKLSQP